VRSGQLDPARLYVFEEDALWQVAQSRLGVSDFSGVVDGFRIIAPDFTNKVDGAGRPDFTQQTRR